MHHVHENQRLRVIRGIAQYHRVSDGKTTLLPNSGLWTFCGHNTGLLGYLRKSFHFWLPLLSSFYFDLTLGNFPLFPLASSATLGWLCPSLVHSLINWKNSYWVPETQISIRNKNQKEHISLWCVNVSSPIVWTLVCGDADSGEAVHVWEQGAYGNSLSFHSTLHWT